MSGFWWRALGVLIKFGEVLMLGLTFGLALWLAGFWLAILWTSTMALGQLTAQLHIRHRRRKAARKLVA